MALEGTLKDFALPDIFQLIGLQKKTGVLVLSNEQDEVSIAFKDGLLVSADSKKKRLEDRLGSMLVRSGLITEGQLHDLLEKQKQTFQRIGVLAVNEGLVKKGDLRKALELQVTQLIYRVFRWEDAEYRFDQDAQVDFDRENFTPIGAESVLMEGMRILDEWPIVEKVVRSVQLVYDKVPVNQPIEIEQPEEESEGDDDDFDFDMSAPAEKPQAKSKEEVIKLSAQEGAVWKLLDGRRTVEDVMYLARLSEFDTCKALYDLLNRDLIREVVPQSGQKAAGKGSVLPLPAEASPAVTFLVHAVVLALVVAGAVFHVRAPWNQRQPFGLVRTDIDRQDIAASESRLDRVAHAVEAQRLAFGDTAYTPGIEDVVDAGYVRNDDLHSPSGLMFDYTVLDDGQSYTLQGYDALENALPELKREGGEAVRRRHQR